MASYYLKQREDKFDLVKNKNSLLKLQGNLYFLKTQVWQVHTVKTTEERYFFIDVTLVVYQLKFIFPHLIL
jgi:hypothetical protein